MAAPLAAGVALQAMVATRMPMILTDARVGGNLIVFANAAFSRLTGYGESEIIGRNCRFLQGPATDPAAIAAIRDAVSNGDSTDVDILNYRKDGSSFWNAMNVTPVRDEAGELTHFFASQIDVTARVEAEARLRDEKERTEREVARRTADLEIALAAKNALVHEVDHRVKNNLQMIVALIVMQTRAADPVAQAPLRDLLGRIEAFGAVHRRLYQMDDVTRFDVGDMLGDVARDVVAATERADIALDIDVVPLRVAAERAAPLALLVNEVLTNSVRHAFPDGRAGKIFVRMRPLGEGLTIDLADDGVGMGGRAPARLGRKLATVLSRQLRAEVHWLADAPGTHVRLTLADGVVDPRAGP